MSYIHDHLKAFVVVFAVLAALVIVGALNAGYAALGGQPPITVAGPAAGSPFIQVENLCPAGWLHTTSSPGSTVEETCSMITGGPVVAVMVPHSKIAEYGRDTHAGANADPAKTIDCDKIPGWPKERC